MTFPILSRSILGLAAAVAAVAPASAYTDFALDRLELEWSRADAGLQVTYTDHFDDGDPLTGPNFRLGGTPVASTGRYFVTTRSGGTPAAGSEALGKLHFAWDDMSDSYFGGNVDGRVMHYFLGTGTQYTPDNGTPLINRGLFKANDFRYTTVWDFRLGADSDNVRSRLTDAFPDHPSNDLIDLSVRTTAEGFKVRQRRLFVAEGGTDQDLWTEDLGAWLGQFDQIALSFLHVAGADFVTTHYALLDAGNVVHESTLGELTLYHGEDWTRASFGSFALSAPIPEPASVALMLAGLGVLGASARRRARPGQA